MESRPLDGRITTRRDLLQALVADEVDTCARIARMDLWLSRGEVEPVPRIAIRNRFLVRTTDHAEDTRIRKVCTSRGAALQVLLLALFELQVRSPREREDAGRTRLPIRRKTDRDITSWVALTALSTTDATGRRTHARKPAANRERRIKKALDGLAACGRLELEPEGRHGRYEHFRVLDEGSTNSKEVGPTSYEVPTWSPDITFVPAAFFVNGWVHALTDTEILTYLTLRYMSQRFPGRHAETGVYLTQATREAWFNLDRGFEAHRMLSRFGLIVTTRDPRRNADGTFPEQADHTTGELHRFHVVDTGLDREAVPTVINALTGYQHGHDLDEARLALFELDARRE